MDLEFIKYLLKEVEKERRIINNKAKAYRRYEEAQQSDNDYRRVLEEYWTTKRGSKAKVKEYLKTIRRITLEIEKEMEG